MELKIIAHVEIHTFSGPGYFKASRDCTSDRDLLGQETLGLVICVQWKEHSFDRRDKSNEPEQHHWDIFLLASEIAKF